MALGAAELIATLEARGLYLAIAESLTGGLLAAEFVAVPGASKVLLGSITAYQNSIKQNLLDVPPSVLETRGAVSAEVAEAMAVGVQQHFAKAAGVSIDRVIALSTTGVAGPDPDGDKPVGLAYIGFAIPGVGVGHAQLQLAGDRAQIRAAVVRSALSELGEQIGA